MSRGNARELSMNVRNTMAELKKNFPEWKLICVVLRPNRFRQSCHRTADLVNSLMEREKGRIQGNMKRGDIKVRAVVCL